VPTADAPGYAAIALETTITEASKVHYTTPFVGRVEARTSPAADLWFMDSIVSRTSVSPPTDGLDEDTALAAILADETIRQLAFLSTTGAFVPDEPKASP